MYIVQNDPFHLHPLPYAHPELMHTPMQPMQWGKQSPQMPVCVIPDKRNDPRLPCWVDPGAILKVMASIMGSARDHPVVVRQYLAAERAENRLLGPFLP